MSKFLKITKMHALYVALGVAFISSATYAQTRVPTKVSMTSPSAVSPLQYTTFFQQQDATFFLAARVNVGPDVPITLLPPIGAITIKGTGDIFAGNSVSNCTVLFNQFLPSIPSCPLRFGAIGSGELLVEYEGNLNYQPSSAVFKITVIDNPAITDPTGDADADGIPNGLEPGLGKNVLLKDNDVFNNAKLYVSQLYRDFLFREATDADRLFWVGELSARRYTRASLASAFVNSPEFQERGGALVRASLAATGGLSLSASPPDFQTFFNAMSTENFDLSLRTFVSNLAGSTEFSTRYGTLTNEQFIVAIFRDVLGRQPSSDELKRWLTFFSPFGSQGEIHEKLSPAPFLSPRGSMLLELSQSSEFRTNSTNQVAVSMAYLAFLHRKSEPEGYAYWVGALQQGMTKDQQVEIFINSNEYRSRLVLPFAVDPPGF